MQLLNIIILGTVACSFVSGLEAKIINDTDPTSQLISTVVKDVEASLSALAEQHQLSPHKKKEVIGLLLTKSLIKSSKSLKDIEEKNHFSKKELEKYLKRALATSPEINKLENNLAQVIADKKEISPRFFGKIKQWFISKTVRVVASLMSLPPSPTDADFEDDNYFKTAP